MKVCKKCNKEVKEEEFGTRNSCNSCERERVKKWNENNKEKRKISVREYNNRNKDKLKEYRREWSKNNIKTKKARTDEDRRKRNEYEKKRRKNDKLYNLKKSISRLIYNSIKRQNFSKKHSTFDILGCSFDEFKIHIEKQFENWMNWDNYGSCNGNYNETWQFDHIKPLSSAINETELLNLNHFTNLRPLCSKLNIEKGNK